jgi:hypothetical protein
MKNREERVIFFDTRILRATEAFLHCARLYRGLGAEPSAQIELRVRYSGLRGRKLAAASPFRWVGFYAEDKTEEDELFVSPLIFKLSEIDSNLLEMVKHVCAPLFMLFDFTKFDDSVYQDFVTNFVQGKIK